MSLLFKYRRVPIVRPAIALGGVLYRPKPIVGVTLLAGTRTALADGLLDTGADDTVFPDLLAVRLGLDLTNAPVGEAVGVASTAVPIRFAQITLRLTDGIELCEWTGWVGFTSAPLRLPLLGFAGCLQYFQSDFQGGQEEVELTPVVPFPGRFGPLIP